MQLRTADGRTLWLAYGMNVHPGGTPATTIAAIESTVLPLRERLGVTGPFGMAVRWDAQGVQDRAAFQPLRALLQEHDLRTFTGNAFVHGAFHGTPLKDDVYRPAWGTAERRTYTELFASELAQLLPPGSQASLSTSPGGWKGWGGDREALLSKFAMELLHVTTLLRGLEENHGVRIVLGIEPEPGCLIETTQEMLDFAAGPLGDMLNMTMFDLSPYVGVCYDVCHQAVEWEEAEANLRALGAAGLPLAKVQASCALELPDPHDEVARAALARFDEPVYLHQVGARDADGHVHIAADLGPVLDDPAWRERGPWRSHFHVPVFRSELIGGLRTTQPELERVLRLVAREDITDHIEIETYTWDVLPEAEKAAGSGFELVDALEQEYRWVLDVLAQEGTQPLGLEPSS